MKIKLLIISLVISYVSVNVASSQTSYSDDFSSELNESVWISQEGHNHSILNGHLMTRVDKRDQSQNFRIEFSNSPLNVASNPVMNFKIKSDKAIILSFYFFAGTYYVKEVSIPKSDELVPVCVDFSGAPSKFDMTLFKFVDVYVNKDAVSHNGVIYLDDFKIGQGAKLHANMGGLERPVLYGGDKSVKLFVKDIVNAESLEVSGGNTLLENIKVSPIFESTFSNYAWFSFDVKEGAEGDGQIQLTAKGAGKYDDNSILLDFSVVSNMAPKIDQPADMEAASGKAGMVELRGISDGDNNKDQPLTITASSSNKAVIPDETIRISYKSGSPYAALYFKPVAPGSAAITVSVDDGQTINNKAEAKFNIVAWENLNLSPSIDPIADQVPYFDGNESVIMLTGISDGNSNTQNLSFMLTSSDQSIVENESLQITDVNPALGTALLHYTPIAEGTVKIKVSISDDAAGTDNGVKEVSTEFLAKPVTLYPRGIDWNLARNSDRWSGDSGISVKATTFGGEDVLEVTCVDKWIWGALNFGFRDTSINLTEHPYVSLDIYSVNTRTLHWLWFYDDWEITHPGEAHRNDFPNVTNDEGKAVWAEANQWTTVTFDFSGENEMSQKVGDEAVAINVKRIVRILYNYHNKETEWPRPPEYSGTFYIKNFRVGNKAVMPDPLATINPVADQVTYVNPGPQSLTITGLTDGKGGIPNLAVQSLNPGFVNPTISAVNQDGTAVLNYNPGSAEGEARIVLTASAANAVTVTDTFLIKTLIKSPSTASGISIDLSQKYQIMQGMGTYMNEYYDLYTTEMGATAMRVGIISNQIEPVNDNFDPYVLNRDKLNYNAFNWGAMRQMKEMGVETFILTSWSAPGWMKDNHSESWYQGAVVKWEQAKNRTSPFYYEEWAEYFVAAYRMFEEEAGIQLAGIGIQNEPAFYEPYPSAILSPAEFAKMVAVLGKRFEMEGIKTKLFMPEQVFSQPNYSMTEYMDAVHANPEANKYTDVIAVHGYASDGIGSGTPNFSAWKAMYNKAQEGQRHKELWMTETHRAYNGYDDAMWIAMAVYGGLEFGNISLWTQWAIVGQHIIDGKPTQMLYTLANFSRFIKPGAVRVKSVSSNNGLFSTSWLDEKSGKLSTVVINNSQAPVSSYLTGNGVPKGYKMYLTTSIRGCEYMGEAPDSLFVVPAKSVLTLVSSGNKAPTIDPVEDLYLEMNAPQQSILLSGIDPADDLQSIASITVTSNNPQIISNPVVGALQPDGTANLTFQPMNGKSGVATLTLTVKDDGPSFVANSKTISFDVMVYDVWNNPPIIDRIEDKYLMEDEAGVHTVAVAMHDGDGGTQILVGSVETNNPGLISGLTFNASNQAVEFSLVPEHYGQANIKLTITDNGGSSSNNGNQSAVAEFSVMVASVNDAPVVTQHENILVPMNASEQTVTITGIGYGDSWGASQKVTLTAEVDDLTLLTPPVVQYSQGTQASIKFTPIRNKTGKAILTVYVKDDGGVMNAGVDVALMSFEVLVQPSDVNVAPFMTEIPNQVLYLSEGAKTITLDGVDDGNPEKNQTISITASSSNGGVATTLVNWVPSLGMGSIKITPVSLGNCTITLSLKDNGGTDWGGVDTQVYTFEVVVYQNVGIEEFAAGISLFPNPAGNYLFISVPEGMPAYSLSITEVSGRVILNKKPENSKTINEIDISTLDTGTYILILNTRDSDYRRIFIKQ